MNLLQTLSIILGTCNLMLCGIVFSKKSRTAADSLFMASCLLTSTTLFIYAFIWWVPDSQIVKPLYLLTVGTTVFGMSTNLLFYIEFTGLKLHSAVKILIYLPALTISIAGFFTQTLFKDFHWINGSWHVVPAYGSPWSFLYIGFYYIACPILLTLLLRRWVKQTKLRKNRILARILITAFLFLFLGSFLFDYLMPLTGNNLPPSGPLFYALYVMSLFYCMFKYNFLTFDLSSTTSIITSSIHDFVIVLDKDCIINSANRRFEERFGAGKNTALVDVLIPDADSAVLLFELFEGQSDNIRTTLHFRTEQGELHGEAQCSRIKDSSGDFQGALCIIRETRAPKDFVEAYNLTDRQYEIIGLIMQGQSNKDIAQNLNLSRRTVETHLNTIYNKLSVRNRQGVLKLTRDFGLF